MPELRHLIVILGDQCDLESAALNDADPARDLVWMAEVEEESKVVWSHQTRTALFLSAMRHFAQALRERGFAVDYTRLPDGMGMGLAEALGAALDRLRPKRVVMVEPGEWRLTRDLPNVAAARQIPCDVREDTHFLCSRAEFERHAHGRRQLRMEFFYREMRRATGLLMDNGKPAGGEWNYDAENRGAFDASGPGLLLAAPRAFPPDDLTRAVIADVRACLPGHPGDLDEFDWPVTREQALEALTDFLDHRLADFGRYQDAIWTGQPWLYHSRLAAALNLKLLHPLEVCRAVEARWRASPAHIPLAAAEGFIRQILGWREYVRGVYWRFMPDYLERNALGADQPLPRFYWTGDTDMACLRDALRQTLRLGYAHHIQRLMVTGLYTLLLGVRPREVHAWYLAVYVDAVEWVELPNTLGMSQYADGGVMASKPYLASGKYIQRMSNACRGCRYDPAEAVGPNACPYTTLYWDTLDRHRVLLAANPRMVMQVRNLDRLSPERLTAIRSRAQELRRQAAEGAAT